MIVRTIPGGTVIFDSGIIHIVIANEPVDAFPTVARSQRADDSFLDSNFDVRVSCAMYTMGFAENARAGSA